MLELGRSSMADDNLITRAEARNTERKNSKENYAADELLLVAHSLLECAFWAAEDDEGLRRRHPNNNRGRAR